MTIKRRTLVAAAVAFAFTASSQVHTAVAKTLEFTPAKFNKQLKSGKPFMLGVHTSWCTTCAKQKRVIGGLRGESSAYKNLTILEMDWDVYRGSKLGRQLRIPRRSTLIMFSNGKEVGRTVAGTSKSLIKGLIDKGL